MSANTIGIDQEEQVASAIFSALREKTPVEPSGVGNEDDIFGSLGLDSMQTFGVLVSLEKRLGIAIDVDNQAEFERIRTFGGLKSLLEEKLAAR